MTEKNEKALVSIICICWNHENYITQCLNSLLEQTYQNIEIIFIDNLSTDHSFEIANQLLSDSKIPF